MALLQKNAGATGKAWDRTAMQYAGCPGLVPGLQRTPLPPQTPHPACTIGSRRVPVVTEPKTRATERLLRRHSPDPETPYLRIFKSNVFVRDLDRSLPFYIDSLGFTVLADSRFEFGRWVAVAPPDGSAILALIAPRKGTENYRFIGGRTNVSFIAEDINATYELWNGRGVKFLQPPQPQLWGGTFATFTDIDGNVFELLSSDELSREIEAHRRAASERIAAERRAAQEIEIAKQVQARLFPQTAPALRTLDYAGICIQARHVGGDYYDFLTLDPGRIGLLVADISGKGIAAALLMANLQANLRGQIALAGDCPLTFLAPSTRSSSTTPSTALTPPSSLPSTTTRRASCATPTAAICRVCCCALRAVLNNSAQPEPSSDSSVSGTATLASASLTWATPWFSTQMA